MKSGVERAGQYLRPIVSCAAAFNTIMAALLLLLAMLTVGLSIFGIRMPNLIEALR